MPKNNYCGGTTMKKTLAFAVVLASVVTFAQNETPATATAPEAVQAAPAAKSKVKKIKKSKKAKAGAANDSMTKPVPALTAKESATATPTIAQAATDAGKTVVDAKPSAAAGTSTIATADVAPTKKLNGFVNVYSTNDAYDTSFNQTLTSIGGSYKFNDKLTLKVGESFETLSKGNKSETAEGREMIDKSNFRPSHLDVNIGTTLPGIFGSKDQPASLNYRAMGSDAVYTTNGGYKGVLAMYEANLSTPFVINTKWDVNVISQIRHVVNKGDEKADSNRVLAIPYATYTINDTFSVYQAAGLIYSFQDNMALRKKFERLYLETGFNITASKTLSFSFDISQDKAIASSDPTAKVSKFNLYSSNIEQDGTLDAVAYEGYINYSF